MDDAGKFSIPAMSASTSRRRLLGGGLASAAGLLTGAAALAQPASAHWEGERRWSWCYKCQALYWHLRYSGDLSYGTCPAGDPSSPKHMTQGPQNYYVHFATRTVGFNSRNGWYAPLFECTKCRAMFLPANYEGGGVCANGYGSHYAGRPASMLWGIAWKQVLDEDDELIFTEDGWACCDRCRILYYSRLPGHCAAAANSSDGHTPNSSLNLWLYQGK